MRGLHTYEKVLYEELYSHIDLLVYGREGRIKQEYRVKQGGNVSDIAIQYEGVKNLIMNERGELEIETTGGVRREGVPLTYQIIDGQRVTIESEYILDNKNTVRFKVGEYKKDEELVIDPELIYSTFLGGSDRDRSHALAVDAGGIVFVAGISDYNDFPTTPGSFETAFNGFIDTVVTKMPTSSPMLLTLDGHDFNGSGSSDVSVYRPTNGRWYIKGSAGSIWGTVGDIPVPGDYNGTSMTDIAVWRPSNGRWYIKGIGGYIWGMAGDIPLVR